MTESTPPSRRQLLRLLASSALASVLAPSGIDRVLGRPLDQGIGGTGAAPPPTDESDRGIGGTGVIGTIKKFGSIYVNDLRIAYPEDAEVRIDGVPASLADLRIGQVVRVDASRAGDAYSTQRIFVTSEVVGPVEHLGRDLVVLGQTVSTEAIERRTYALGETLAVSGLRRNDGTIVASLIEPRPGAPARVAGPILRDEGGGLRVGDLPLDGVDPRLIGHRARLEGRLRGDGVFEVRRGYTDTSLFPKTVRNLSVESYVERRDGAFATGSGFALAGNPGVDIAEGESVRAVLTTSIDRDGRLSVDGVRAGGRSYRVSPGGGRGPGGGGRGPGGGGRGGPGGHEGGRGEGGRGGRGEGGRGDRGQGGRDQGGRGQGDRGGRGGNGDRFDGGRDGGRFDGHGGPGGSHGFNEGGRGGHGGPGDFRGQGPGGFHGPGGFGPGGYHGGPGPGGFHGHGPGGFHPGGLHGPRGGFHGGGFHGGGFHGGRGGGGHGGGRGRR